MSVARELVDTGIEWLNRLPKEWSVVSLGRECWVRARLGWKGLKAEEYVEQSGFAMLSTPDIKSREIDFQSAARITKARFEESPEIMLQVGDVLLTKDGSTIGTSNIVRDLPEPATLNGSIALLTPSTNLIGRYLYYVTVSNYAQAIFDLLRGGAGVPHLFQRDINRIRVPLPPFDEQRVIADYLDQETAQIDALVAKQEAFIGLLRERRVAVIENAVFAGVRGARTVQHAEPWLLPMAEHWRVTQLGYVTDTVAGYAFPSDGFSTSREHNKLLRGINVKPGRTDWSETVFWDQEALPVPSEYQLVARDIVLGMDRPFVGEGVRVTAIAEDDLPALLVQRVMRIRPTGGSTRYLRYILETGSFYAYLSPMFTGVSVPHMSEWQVRKFKLPYPPLDEQCEIADHIDEQTRQIDSLIAKAEEHISLAKERRAALITAAVTGQFDVRTARKAG